jgi:hypothetical protein
MAERVVQKACDRCTQGVMAAANDHLWGRCRCACHALELNAVRVLDEDETAVALRGFRPLP